MCMSVNIFLIYYFGNHDRSEGSDRKKKKENIQFMKNIYVIVGNTQVNDDNTGIIKVMKHYPVRTCTIFFAFCYI